MEANCLQGETYYDRIEELIGVDYFRAELPAAEQPLVYPIPQSNWLGYCGARSNSDSSAPIFYNS